VTTLDRQASELELERWLRRAAARAGYCGFHVAEASVHGVHTLGHDGHADAIGFPDWLLAKAGKPLLFVELKGYTGATNGNQQRWLQTLRETSGPTVARLAWPRHAAELLELMAA
jgi:hypothetical protein